MIEIKKEQADTLYSQVKSMILSRKNESEYNYEKKQHFLYEQDASPELQANFYNESGSLEIQNISGEIIVVEINRWHAHKHNGWSGLNGTPCLSAIIYIKEKDEKKQIWELKVVSGTMHYKAETTSFEIPKKVLLKEIREISILSDEQHDGCSKDEQSETQKPLLKALNPKKQGKYLRH